MQSGFQVLKYHCWVQVNEMTRYQVPREETSINLTTLVLGLIIHKDTWSQFLLMIWKSVQCPSIRAGFCCPKQHPQFYMNILNNYYGIFGTILWCSQGNPIVFTGEMLRVGCSLWNAWTEFLSRSTTHIYQYFYHKNIFEVVNITWNSHHV